VINALTSDVEEYFHPTGSTVVVWPGRGSSFRPGVEDQICRILDLLAHKEGKATFFILGWVADDHPAIVRRIGRGCDCECLRPLGRDLPCTELLDHGAVHVGAGDPGGVIRVSIPFLMIGTESQTLANIYRLCRHLPARLTNFRLLRWSYSKGG
jgi:peptidoglycan/xylan/chitin deacetylase (PgdA/CDA1 family)